ncbi:protein FAM204A isoform X2 [Hyla sarda]|uniref:protein FAM204A isoform X2 n=1 Tax=Hyla sarda TaxID=327740 RepID=UPI0024C2B19E|nr:protein FAM204A isoform X2 [Hyla sarda]
MSLVLPDVCTVSRMWSGLLPPGVTESDLSSTGEEEGGAPVRSTPETSAVPESCVTKFLELQKRRSELEVEPRVKRRRHRKGKRKQRPPEEQKDDKSSALDTLQQYFGVNDHLEPPVCMKVMKKSRLEQSLDEAVKKGNIEEAEKISDHLATREIAVKITKAAAYHKHMKAKEEPQSSQEAASKRKPPAWGFEAKKRWETKSNMGYM